MKNQLLNRRAVILTDTGGVSKLSRRGELTATAVADALSKAGISADVLPFSEVEPTPEYKGRIVLYQSSEDYDDQMRLRKRYIEHVIHALGLVGAVPIPGYPLLVAHGDKVFQELLRAVLGLGTASLPPARHYGTLESAIAAPPKEFPVVVKKNFGGGSRGVRLANQNDFRQAAAEASGIASAAHPGVAVRNLRRTIIRFARNWRRRKARRPLVQEKSARYNSFIAQRFIPGLDRDYKVLVYGDHYFVLRRSTRPNDFRASGSRIFHFDEPPPSGLFDFAERVIKILDTPWASLDIGVGPTEFHLFEFQALNFGTTTLDKSRYGFKRVGTSWERVERTMEAGDAYIHGLLWYLSERHTG